MNHGTVMQWVTIEDINNGVLEEYIMTFKDVHDILLANQADYKTTPTAYSQFWNCETGLFYY